MKYLKKVKYMSIQRFDVMNFSGLYLNLTVLCDRICHRFFGRVDLEMGMGLWRVWVGGEFGLEGSGTIRT